MEGALHWRMVSTTLFERPEAIRFAPSGATLTVFTTPGEGEGLSLRLREKVPPDKNLPRKTVEEAHQVQEP